MVRVEETLRNPTGILVELLPSEALSRLHHPKEVVVAISAGSSRSNSAS